MLHCETSCSCPISEESDQERKEESCIDDTSHCCILLGIIILLIQLVNLVWVVVDIISNFSSNATKVDSGGSGDILIF